MATMNNTYKVNEEAVKKIAERVYDNGSTVINRNDLEEMFPELKKESEDERIRKAIKLMYSFLPNKPKYIGDVSVEDMFAWLEKQAQKPAFEMKTPEESLNIDSDTYNKIVDECVYELEEQKPAWSEEDGKMINKLLAVVNLYYDRSGNDLDKQSCISFLKSLKDRVQPKQEWSEEEIENCAREAEDNNCIILAKHIRQLKSLRPQNWTKEDKERYISCLQRLSTGNPEQPETINSKWFKEHVYPQSTWKPSGEQMEALEYFVRSIGESGYASPYDNNTKLLYSLLSDLMKLREE